MVLILALMLFANGRSMSAFSVLLLFEPDLSRHCSCMIALFIEKTCVSSVCGWNNMLMTLILDVCLLKLEQ
jgi:hypothetical protein